MSRSLETGSVTPQHYQYIGTSITIGQLIGTAPLEPYNLIRLQAYYIIAVFSIMSNKIPLLIKSMLYFTTTMAMSMQATNWPIFKQKKFANCMQLTTLQAFIEG